MRQGHEDVIVTIGGKTFPADRPMVPLLEAMDKVGLTVTQHCIGDEESDAFIYIDPSNISAISILQDAGDGPRLVIRWKRKETAQ